MIVDCHTHIGSGGQAGEFSEHFSAAEPVDVSIVLADESGSSEQNNDTVAEYVKNHPSKLVGFAVLDPRHDKIRPGQLDSSVRGRGLEGIVLYCARGGFHPAHSRAMELYGSAQELSLPVFFHNTSDSDPRAILDYAQPYLLDEVARCFPELKIIIGSMGTPFVSQSLTMAAKHKNVYSDLTLTPSSVWDVYNTVVAAYERRVMDKLIFGSGYPASKPGRCIETLLGFNKLLGDSVLVPVPRGSIRSVVESDTLQVLGISQKG